ncbi:MAG: hypothetical protein NDI58_04850, partial [Geothrix sp.]|nr:hypothetical protein [Geothrix sp.]
MVHRISQQEYQGTEPQSFHPAWTRWVGDAQESLHPANEMGTGGTGNPFRLEASQALHAQEHFRDAIRGHSSSNGPPVTSLL